MELGRGGTEGEGRTEGGWGGGEKERRREGGGGLHGGAGRRASWESWPGTVSAVRDACVRVPVRVRVRVWMGLWVWVCVRVRAESLCVLRACGSCVN